jgi:hypothetical protein
MYAVEPRRNVMIFAPQRRMQFPHISSTVIIIKGGIHCIPVELIINFIKGISTFPEYILTPLFSILPECTSFPHIKLSIAFILPSQYIYQKCILMFPSFTRNDVLIIDGRTVVLQLSETCFRNRGSRPYPLFLCFGGQRSANRLFLYKAGPLKSQPPPLPFPPFLCPTATRR